MQRFSATNGAQKGATKVQQELQEKVHSNYDAH